MAATILNTKRWSVVLIDGHWRHVSHRRRLATSGWGTREACKRNANGYRGDPAVIRILAERYATLYPERMT